MYVLQKVLKDEALLAGQSLDIDEGVIPRLLPQLIQTFQDWVVAFLHWAYCHCHAKLYLASAHAANGVVGVSGLNGF
jgi:hypothetical protein